MSTYGDRTVGTKWREQFEADKSDFTVGNTVGLPTAEELKELPEEVKLIPTKTYNQKNIGACTAFGLTHVQLYQNCKEFESSLIELDPWSLWINMGHDPKNTADGGDYLENALKVSKEKGINGTGPTGKTMTFLTDSFAYRSFGKLEENDYNIIKYYLSKGMPIYTAIKGTSKTWREMAVGEVVSVYSAGDTTGGHAIAIYGIDNEYVYFINSREPRPGESISTFKINKKVLTAMGKSGMLNWRYRLIYDKKDITTPALFEDYYKEKGTEEYEAVKWCKDKGIVKGSNGKLLPNQPLTREQMCLIIYRLAHQDEAKATPEKQKKTK